MGVVRRCPGGKFPPVEPVAGRRSPVAGRRSPVAGHRSPVAGCRSPVAERPMIRGVGPGSRLGCVGRPPGVRGALLQSDAVSPREGEEEAEGSNRY